MATQPTDKTQSALEPSSGKVAWGFWAVTIVAGFLLLVANSALWVNNTIFNTANFTRITTAAIEEESSRVAIATAITETLLEGRPVLKQVVDDRAVKLISGLLDSDQADAILRKTIATLQVTMTSENPQSITVDLSGIKSIIQRIISITNIEAENLESIDIPDQLVLLDATKIPQFYQYGVIFLWLSPLALLGGIAGLAYPYFARRKELVTSWMLPLKQGLVILVIGLFGLTLGPLFKPPVMAAINSTYGRVVVGNIYDAFINSFYAQTLWIVYIGILLCLVSAVWWILLNRHKFTQKSQ